MHTPHLTERIHAIRTQTEPYVSHIQIKFRVHSNGFLAGAEEDGGAETSEFGGDKP